MAIDNYQVDHRISLFISYSFILVAINRLTDLPFLVSYQSMIAQIQWVIYVLWFASLYFKVIRFRTGHLVKRTVFITLLLYAVGILISLVNNHPLDILLNHDLMWTFTQFLPVGFAAYVVNDYKVLYNTLYKYSFVISICCTAIFFNYMSNPFGYSYDMTFGYVLLLPTLIHYSWFLNHKKQFWIGVIALGETIMLCLYGSRGDILAIASYFIVRSLFASQVKKRVVIPITIIAGFLVFGGLPVVNDYLESQGIYSRTLMILSTQDAKESSGRNEHWDSGVTTIKQSPIIGYGLGGYYYDFYQNLVSKYPDKKYAFDSESGDYRTVTANFSGTHSGFLDMLLFFGIFAGIPIAIWIIKSISKIRYMQASELVELLTITYSIYIITNMTVGGGIHTKPGCALYFFILFSWMHHRRFNIQEQCLETATKLQ